MLFRVLSQNMESVRHFALFLERGPAINAPGRNHLRWVLWLVPANIQWRHDVEEQVGGNAARVIPILAKTEIAVSIPWSGRRRPQPHLPVDIILALAVRPGCLFNRPVPFA